MRPKPLMATLTLASVTTFTFACVASSRRQSLVTSSSRVARRVIDHRSIGRVTTRTLALARGADALRKLPARAVRAVSSTVCEDTDKIFTRASRQSSIVVRRRSSSSFVVGRRRREPPIHPRDRDRSLDRSIAGSRACGRPRDRATDRPTTSRDRTHTRLSRHAP